MTRVEDRDPGRDCYGYLPSLQGKSPYQVMLGK